MRVYGAWASRVITDYDSSVVALMARHMAAGREWPVFFYGQAYMGTPEPAASALLVRLLGPDGFAVCLGPALYALAALALLYLWARDAGGRAAGLAALALCAVGPRDFLLFQFAPRGGYMAASAFGLAVVWLAARIAARERERRPPGLGAYAALGLAAGLGWWSSPLTAAALVLGAALVAAGRRGRVWGVPVALAALAFLAASAPFWVWNARHGWETFAMTGRLGGVGFGRGWAKAGARYEDFLGVAASGGPLREGAKWFYGVLVCAGAGLAARQFARRRARLDGLAALAALAFAAASLAIYLRSSYVAMRTGRYFVPMVPAMAVLAGLACAALARTRLGWAGAAAPVAVAWALQAPGVVELRALARGAPERARHYAALVAALERRGIEAAFGHLSFYPLNFLSGERIAVTSLRGERYLPIAGRVEEATRVGVLDNHGGVRELLACSGGTRAAAAVEGHGLDFGFVPPPAGRQEIPPERWAAAADASGADLRAALSDRDLGTAWTAPPGTDAWVAVELRFRAPEAVRLLRWVPPPGAPPPAGLRVEEWPAGASGWARPREFPALSSFHWSDGRPYAGGRRFRLEYSAGDRRVEALRLRVPRGRRGAAPALAELQVFAPAPDPPAEEPSVAALLEWASSNGIRRVHADRGLSVRLHAAAPGAMQVELEPGFQAGDPAVAGGRFAPEPGVALVVPAGEADISREVLSAAGMAFAEVRIGPWDVFHRFAAPRAGAARTTYWTGVQVLFGSSSP